MKQSHFDELMMGFKEAIKYRQGDKTARVRVTRFAPIPKPLKPADIRRIRMTLRISQREFAQYLGVSLGTARSWEQGSRRPQSTALRLLTIAKRSPATLLQRD